MKQKTKLRKFIFCKGKGGSNKILEFNGQNKVNRILNILGIRENQTDRRNINSLYDQNGVITRQQTKILQLSKSYYGILCKSTHPNIEEVKTLIDNTKINKTLRMEESLI